MDEKRAEILKIYPQAVWFPGDAPPVGKTVRYANEENPLGVVTGVEGRSSTSEHPQCSHCRYEIPNSLAGWWFVKMDRKLLVHGVEQDAVVYAYPPSLVPVEEQGS